MNEITRASLAVEINGKPYFVALSQDELLFLVKMSASFFENKQIKVVPAPDNICFIELGKKS